MYYIYHAEEIKPHQQNVVVLNLSFYETNGYKSLAHSVCEQNIIIPTFS